MIRFGRIINGSKALLANFFKVAQAGGRTWDLFVFLFIFSFKSSALDHSATAPPQTPLLATLAEWPTNLQF